LEKERIYLYVHFDEPLESGELARFREMVKKRALRIPVAYILGRREFMGHEFKVTPDVLIPRPDTEILVESVIERLKHKGELFFADIGTGSGAIALSILKALPELKGAAVDISAAALAVAKENAANLGVSERVEFLQGDLLEPLQGRRLGAIISNPPYIPDGDIDGLEAEVKKEPRGALAGGRDGLDFYRRLIREGGKLLEDGGLLAFEVGIYQAAAVKELAEDAAIFENIAVIEDYGKIERVVIMNKRVNGK
jgi:release factor glutamine methyltransferase